MQLNRIGAAAQPECLRPQRDGANDPDTSLLTGGKRVGPAVPSLTTDRVGVVAPYPVDMDQRTLPWAVAEVLDGRDGHHRLQGHGTRSAP